MSGVGGCFGLGVGDGKGWEVGKGRIIKTIMMQRAQGMAVKDGGRDAT